MCGVIGILNQTEPVCPNIIHGLNMLQHRGSDSTGIMTLHNNIFYSHKQLGKVNDVYTPENTKYLQGNIGIGHVRYCTMGQINTEQAHPLYTNTPYGIALVHNGNLTNTEELRNIVEKYYRHINSSSDSELLLNLFASLLPKKDVITNKDIFDVVKQIMELCKGSFSVIIMMNKIGLIAFRDKNGIRPLCYCNSNSNSNSNNNYIIASESSCIDALINNNAEIYDIQCGECIIFRPEYMEKQIIANNPILKPCIFEYIYFARPDTTINNILVYDARIKMGETLANKIMNQFPNISNNIDVVMPVPETSRIYGLCISQILNKPYYEGFIKNHYISRTFIMPNQETRVNNIKIKLNTIKKEFYGKNILIIDDSIVRGNTSLQLIKMAKEAGVKKIYFGSIAPPIRYPNIYGIDIQKSEDLIAYNKTENEIAKLLGIEQVIYNDLDDIIKACSSLQDKHMDFETSCFDGIYL
jgi:amidophosphoribosyltransferase